MNANLPAPIPPLPSDRQLRRMSIPLTMFVHFGLNTFSGHEWGSGDVSPRLFNPSEENFCRQWTDAAASAGMKGIVLTCKHHDGFCLWPTATTEYSVRNSPWKNGRGDVVLSLSNACRDAGLALGIYLSPWDRNHPAYGTEEYNSVYKAALTELLTGYGEIFEVWLDGACGEGRQGLKQRYDWPGYMETIRTLQPGAAIFSDAGPDVRWVGNERGQAGKTNWSFMSPDGLYPGVPPSFARVLNEGMRDGTHWMTAEADVSIRPGWFHHRKEDRAVKSVSDLMRLYHQSVGRSSLLLLNVPPQPSGFFALQDVRNLRNFGKRLKEENQNELLAGHLKQGTVSLTASASRTGCPAWMIADGNAETFWAPGVSSPPSGAPAELRVQFRQPTVLKRINLAEPVHMGQRVSKFAVDYQRRPGGRWRHLASGTTIGLSRILVLRRTRVCAVRLTIRESRAEPLISGFQLYS